MMCSGESQILRIYIEESTQCGHRPLYEVVVDRARRRGLAGATAIRGIMGFGSSGQVRQAKVLSLWQDTPVILEIVDEPKSIEAFLLDLEGLIQSGLVTLQKVRVLTSGSRTGDRTSGSGTARE
jgi:PII-like signaling protein